MNSYPEYCPMKNSTRIGPRTPKKLGSLKGRDPIDAEHRQRIGIVAEHHSPAFTRSPP